MFRFAKFFVFVLLFISFKAEAASLYIDPAFSTLYRGDSLTASVRIMPDKETGECINVVDGVITYSENIQPVDISTARSILSIWVEAPKINPENRTITFAGGIPNGYCGRVDGDPSLTNVALDVVFRSPGMQVGNSSDNQAFLDFAPGTRMLLNDGQGTEAPLRTFGSTITLEKGPGSEIKDEWRGAVQADNLPPEEFSITLTKDEKAFSGKYFIVFNTSDKQTGISHYEVMEEPVEDMGLFSWGGVGVPWIQTVSPYVLKDQSLNSVIRVKAIDKAGNEYIATLIPDEPLRTISKNQILDIVLIVALVVLSIIILIVIYIFVIRPMIKRRKEKKMKTAENDIVGSEGDDGGGE